MLRVLAAFLFSAYAFISAESAPPVAPAGAGPFVRGIEEWQPETANVGHEIVKEEVVYDRWRRIIQRAVRMPNGKVVDFDVSFGRFGQPPYLRFAAAN